MNKKYYGIFLAAFSSTLWGIGGNFTQYIFNNSNFNYISLVAVRMLVAGILFILYGAYKDGINKAYDMVNNRYKFFDLLIYSIFGMLGVQLPFFAIWCSNISNHICLFKIQKKASNIWGHLYPPNTSWCIFCCN